MQTLTEKMNELFSLPNTLHWKQKRMESLYAQLHSISYQRTSPCILYWYCVSSSFWVCLSPRNHEKGVHSSVERMKSICPYSSTTVQLNSTSEANPSESRAHSTGPVFCLPRGIPSLSFEQTRRSSIAYGKRWIWCTIWFFSMRSTLSES